MPPTIKNPEPYQASYYPPRPTGITCSMRTFWPWQLLRFIIINIKMLKLMARSHH